MGEVWIALAVAFILIGSMVLNNDNGIRLIIFGPPSEYGDFKTPPRLIYFILLLSALALLGAVQYVASRTSQQFDAHKEETDSRRSEEKRIEREAELKAEQERAALELEKRLTKGQEILEARISRLEQQDYTEIATTKISGGKRITQGTRTNYLLGLEVKEVRVEIDDEFGTDLGFVVIHLFENVAYWSFDSAASFQDQSGKAFMFGEHISQSSLSSTLKTYDMLIAIGLESNSKTQKSDLGYFRAAHLCSLLLPYAGDHSSLFGLQIGRYLDNPRETRTELQPGQRSVVIIGADGLNAEVPAEARLFEEVIRSVKYSGIDLSQYSGFRFGGTPRWLNIQECKAPFR